MKKTGIKLNIIGWDHLVPLPNKGVPFTMYVIKYPTEEFEQIFTDSEGNFLKEKARSDENTFVHNQSTPLATWTVPHDRNGYPSVTVVDSAGDKVISNVTYINKSLLEIKHGAAFSGKAYLNN